MKITFAFSRIQYLYQIHC